MKIIVVTGGIGSGKSLCCRLLSERGVPVYDCDSAAKALYEKFPDLKSMLVPDIFSRPDALARLEAALFPRLMEDFEYWCRTCGDVPAVAFESATVLDKEFFDGFGDYVVYVDAPEEERIRRVMERSGLDRARVRERMALQNDHGHNPRVSALLDNSASPDALAVQIDKFLKINNIMAKEKTDLSKILSVSGRPGLYRFVAQSRIGAIAENLIDKARTNFPANGKITSLEDISIYTDDGEVKLREVFGLLKGVLGEEDAPSAKGPEADLKSLFEKALPGYDRDRFYVSHMRKVVTWYNLLKSYASLDFVDPDAEQQEEGGAEEGK